MWTHDTQLQNSGLSGLFLPLRGPRTSGTLASSSVMPEASACFCFRRRREYLRLWSACEDLPSPSIVLVSRALSSLTPSSPLQEESEVYTLVERQVLAHWEEETAEGEGAYECCPSGCRWAGVKEQGKKERAAVSVDRRMALYLLLQAAFVGTRVYVGAPACSAFRKNSRSGR